MGVSISGSTAISGLGGSDTNFDKVLEQLKSIESTQLKRLEAWKSDWSLRYEAFTQIIDQVQAASSMLSQLSNKNNFVSKVVQSSNDNCITAVANASAQDVQHVIKVTQTASNAIWANTSHVFKSKTDVINDTKDAQYFNYSYAGKDYKFKVPANTTLESFASMINNSTENPGIKVSIISTGNGYVFQVSGKDSGVDHDLQIYASDLVGMRAAGSTSNWVTNEQINLDNALTNPNQYAFDVVFQGGTKKTLIVDGNITAEEFKNKLNNLGACTATIEADGSLKIDGIQSITRRGAKDDPYTPASTKITLNGSKDTKLNESGSLFSGSNDSDELTFTITLDNGEQREVKIKADATNEELIAALGQATQSSNKMNVNTAGTGLEFSLAGVKEINVTVPDPSDPADTNKATSQKFGTDIASKGVGQTLGGALASADLTIKFDSAKLSEALGTAGEDLEFTYVDKDGKAQKIYLKGEDTYQALIDRLKGSFPSSDAPAASLGSDDGAGTLVLNGVKEFRLTSGSLESNSVYEVSLKSSVSIPKAVYVDPSDHSQGIDQANSLFYDDGNGNVTLEEAPDLKYTIKTNDGKTYTLTLASESKMSDVVAAMKSGGAVGTWQVKDADGKPVTEAIPAFDVYYTDKDGNKIDTPGNGEEVFVNFRNVISVSGTELKGQVNETSNWNIQRAANAKYTIDNWPIEMESTTNQISDTIEGVIFTIHEAGEARISISTDIPSVEQSIQNFLDAVNSVLLTVNELMKYDETKEVTSNDPNDIGNSNYSASGLTNQKGSLLTGNYGVQLFKSRFTSVLTANPPGFRSQANASDVLSGDVLASLSQLGIKTDTDTTSDTYGLLVLAPSSTIAELQTIDSENYNNLISNNLEAVVDFFCASGIGSSTSTDFRYGSHVEGITKGGVYEVTYHVDANGEISNVMVGGEPAKRDESMPGYYFSVASGDPRGLSINIDDLTPGDHPPDGEEPMYVRIKQGLVQTVNNWFKSELTFNDVNISANSTPQQMADAMYLKSQNGALMSLRDNYMKVMESIDVKIEREQRRIDTWYNRQKSIFANLETLLKQYEQQQSSLESQLKQLSGNS